MRWPRSFSRRFPSKPSVALSDPGGEDSAAEAGMATAEFALVLPVMVAVTGLLVGAIQAGISQLQACEAARITARANAIGIPPPPIPPNMQVQILTSGDWIQASANIQPLRALPVLQLNCVAKAMKERGIGEDTAQ